VTTEWIVGRVDSVSVESTFYPSPGELPPPPPIPDEPVAGVYEEPLE
jgi:hypothetical protein